MADSYTTKLYKPAAKPPRVRPAFRVAQGASAAPDEPAASVEDVPLPEPAASMEVAAPTEQVAATTEQVVVAEPAKPKRRIRAWQVVLGVVLLVALLYGVRVGYSVWRFESQVYVPLPSSTPRANVRPTTTEVRTAVAAAVEKTPVAAVAPATATPDIYIDLPRGRINILIMGTDKRPNDPDHYARSDTMILANVDTISHTVRVMSVPRDLVVRIPGYGLNKINSAYLFGEYYKEPGGGQGLAVATASDYFGVPIDYYVAINFDGFRKLVDIVGGINVDVPYELDDYNYPSDDEGDPFGMLHVHFDAGYQHMNGKEALRYARTRHADNDFMRNKRQLQVILGVRRSAMSLNLIPTLPSLIDQLAGMVETNIPLDKQMALAQFGYSIEASNIITATIDADMITATTLDDGSEGLLLDKKAARPMLEDFFGPGESTLADAGVSSYDDEPTATATRKSGSAARRTATKTPVAKGRSTRTPVPTRTPEEAVGSGSTP